MITRTEDDDRAGDRYVLAYALSIFIHVFLLALFAVRILLPIDSGSTAPETETVAVTSQRATISSAAPVTPPPQTPPPQTPPPETPPPKRVPPRRVVARPRVVRQAPRKSDLAVLSPDGTPEPQHITIVAPEMTLPPTSQPSPEPSVATLSPTLPPVKITPPPETPKPETPQPTVPPTVKPTIVPTVKPTVVPTAKPTIIPTLKPTEAPTAVPSVIAQVTVRPTVVPTARPTAAPTIIPTARPTAAPTKAPTAAATAKPTTAPTTAPTAKPTTALTAAPVVARLTPAPLRTAGTALASANPKAGAGVAGRATAAPKAGTSAGKTPRSASATGGLEGAGAGGGAEKGSVAYAPSGASNPAANGTAESNLNKRLNALLPSGPVAYENKEYIGDLNAAVDQAKAAAIAAVAPPQSVLDHAIAVVRQHGVLLDASSSIVYIIKRQRIFGFNICTGWKISYPAGGGAPQGGYTVGPCSGEAFAPSGGLPTLPPKAQSTP